MSGVKQTEEIIDDLYGEVIDNYRGKLYEHDKEKSLASFAQAYALLAIARQLERIADK